MIARSAKTRDEIAARVPSKMTWIPTRECSGIRGPLLTTCTKGHPFGKFMLFDLIEKVNCASFNFMVLHISKTNLKYHGS
jgi:hypothetical protein